MKTSRQFFALLRFHAFASPWIWVFPVAFGFQPCVSLMFGNNWRDLSGALSSAGMMWMIPMMIALHVFTPELYAGMQITTPQTQQQVQGFSADFLLTRAVDRPVVFKARVVLFWILVLPSVFFLLVLAAWKPALSLEVPLNPPGAGAAYLESLPGASVTKTTKSTEVISSPTGRIAIAGVMALVSVMFAAFCQGFVFAISRFKFRRWIFWAFFILGVGFFPGLMILGKNRWTEGVVFAILGHPVMATGVVGLCVVAAWAFSASRAKTIEYP